MALPNEGETHSRLQSEALACGRIHGAAARELALPPDMFGESLKVMIEVWRRAGCDEAWVQVAEQASRTAYRGRRSAPVTVGLPSPAPLRQAPAAMVTVELRNISKSFGATKVLDGVDFAVEAGTLVAILGPSGSGKTTLLRLLCGFEKVDDGTIEVAGQIVSGRGIHLPPEHRRIGYVAQEGALFPHLSVADNILFGLPRKLRRAGHRVGELLELVGLPAAYAGRPPHELSGGEQQRVALARALAPAPALVLLDEPFSSLDAALRAETRQAIAAALEAVGATAVLVTHDQPEALSMGHRVAVLWKGRIAQSAPPEDLYRLPAGPDLARFVGEAVLLRGIAGDGHVTCALGRLPAEGAVAGPADVLLRPEQIRLLPPQSAAAGRGVKALVQEVVFYGHDASVSLRLLEDPRLPAPKGERLTARVPGHQCPHIGEEVAVVVEGDVVVYEAGASG
jgi:iron(III) transport system ATP-binding protein